MLHLPLSLLELLYVAISISYCFVHALRINVPSETHVCDEVELSWSGSNPPFHLIVYNATPPYDFRQDLGRHPGTSLKWQVAFPENSWLYIEVDDDVGGWRSSTAFSVDASNDETCIGVQPHPPPPPPPISQPVPPPAPPPTSLPQQPSNTPVVSSVHESQASIPPQSKAAQSTSQASTPAHLQSLSTTSSSFSDPRTGGGPQTDPLTASATSIEAHPFITPQSNSTLSGVSSSSQASSNNSSKTKIFASVGACIGVVCIGIAALIWRLRPKRSKNVEPFRFEDNENLTLPPSVSSVESGSTDLLIPPRRDVKRAIPSPLGSPSDLMSSMAFQTVSELESSDFASLNSTSGTAKPQNEKTHRQKAPKSPISTPEPFLPPFTQPLSQRESQLMSQVADMRATIEDLHVQQAQHLSFLERIAEHAKEHRGNDSDIGADTLPPYGSSRSIRTVETTGG